MKGLSNDDVLIVERDGEMKIVVVDDESATSKPPQYMYQCTCTGARSMTEAVPWPSGETPVEVSVCLVSTDRQPALYTCPCLKHESGHVR